ncbi:DnaJ domain [Dillenia turbinata]|uniref:DnaJ domain n=1 Tax=Dillenia turbinata TaxID=194707 RepID=A0AAN8UY04_9MAGN
MASLIGLHRCRTILYSFLRSTASYNLFSHSHSLTQNRWFSRRAESIPNEFTAVKNAYELLGVSETSSFSEIKASFRKLAKETHPDLANSTNNVTASHRFVQILAAYEILSDSEKRAYYDRYLLSRKRLVERHSGESMTFYRCESHMTATREMEVVEWLKWYRCAISDILSEKKIVVGSSYFNVLERDFYSAIHVAYFGPIIESMDLLPDCFEAEERSVYGTKEVLHLVSGRDLFGMICLVDEVPELSSTCSQKLTSLSSMGSIMCQSFPNSSTCGSSNEVDGVDISHKKTDHVNTYKSDASKDLELHVCGRVVAVATRIPPKSCCNGIKNEDSEDHIHVFLRSCEELCENSFLGDVVGSKIHLGTITGLGSDSEEDSCFVFNDNGTKTHVIMKHRTLMVKHLHWYQLGDKVSVCECRCSRAWLPPSKFWLFEPRCDTHDIGGWYVETFGKDKKGRTIPCQRYWDGIDACDQTEKGVNQGISICRRLHPAMYLLALAYRTLDIEDAKRRKQTVQDVVNRKLFRILDWYPSTVRF